MCSWLETLVFNRHLFAFLVFSLLRRSCFVQLCVSLYDFFFNLIIHNSVSYIHSVFWLEFLNAVQIFNLIHVVLL